MTEILSKVYDIVYPSPATLQEISSIAVAADIWHWELQNYGPNDVMAKLNPSGEPFPDVSLPDVISNLPSKIDHMIKNHHEMLVTSIEQWLKDIFCHTLEFHRRNRDDILKDFNDIACDFNGTVNYDRTAKRILQCDRISQDEKFKIACAYCFEDDIERIWPSVESNIDLNMMDFDQCPLVYYWVCRIRNEMDEIPDQGDQSIDEKLLQYVTKSRSVFEYFWNRLSLEMQSERALDICWTNSMFVGFFSKLVVPKLNEQQIIQFLDTECSINWFFDVMNDDGESGLTYVRPIWIFIKNHMKESFFRELVKGLIRWESNLFITDVKTERAVLNDEILTLCCELWSSASDHLKRAVMKPLFDYQQLLEPASEWKVSQYREIRVVLAVLSDASLKERSIFWRNNWLNLLKSTSQTDFIKIMELCLNEEQIKQFRETTMNKFENIKEAIELYLKKEYFQELKDFVSFCCPDQNSRNVLYRKMLPPTFFYKILEKDDIFKTKLRLEFVDDVYANDPDHPPALKNNILSFIWCKLILQIRCCALNDVQEFVDTIESFSQILDKIKKENLVEMLKNSIISNSMYAFDGEKVSKFLFWCWGTKDENEMMKFKQSISPDQVLLSMLRKGMSKQNVGVSLRTNECRMEYPRTLDPFLSWYFDTPEEINEFKTRMADVFMCIKDPVENGSL